MKNKYYPIGTVVILKGGNRPIMIYGRLQMQSTTKKLWDYVACLYPEGNLGDQYNIFFQNVEIEKILHMGFESPLDDKMQPMLEKAKNQY